LVTKNARSEIVNPTYYVVMKIRDLTRKQILSIPCPTCGAAIEEPCELTTGYPRNEPHRNRKLVAADPLHPQAILRQVDTLNEVGITLQILADEHVEISGGLLCVAESVRNVATLLAVLTVTTTG
jgi:hypothetical protein